MIRILRSRDEAGTPAMSAHLTCDVCGRLGEPAMVDARDLDGDLARLRLAAQIAARWCLRTVWRPGDDRPVVGDVCGVCRGPSLALRRREH